MIIINIHWNDLVDRLAKQYLHHLLSCCNIIIFNRSKKWVVNTRRGDLGSKTAKQLYNSYRRICSDHFEDSQYMDPAHTSLMPHAIPTIFRSIPNPPNMIGLKRQQEMRHAPETHAGMHLILHKHLKSYFQSELMPLLRPRFFFLW